MYALRNTNLAKICFFRTKYAADLAIMDIASAKLDVNGPKKSMNLAYFNEKVTETPKNRPKNV